MRTASGFCLAQCPSSHLNQRTTGQLGVDTQRTMQLRGAYGSGTCISDSLKCCGLGPTSGILVPIIAMYESRNHTAQNVLLRSSASLHPFPASPLPLFPRKSAYPLSFDSPNLRIM